MAKRLRVEETKNLVSEVRFDYCEYMLGEDVIDIKKEADKITVTVDSMRKKLNTKYCIPQEEWDSFISKLYDEIHINKWKRSYKPEELLICDGAFWEIQISVDGRRKRIYKGDNTYPDNWDDFAILMEGFLEKEH